MFGQPIQVKAAKKLPPARETQRPLGRHLEGCRIGFDLGGSDRKAAAVIDGKVVFSDEVKWNPYFEKDPAYHLEGVNDSIRRAAAHLPRIDAIGGSAAGVYVNSEPRVGSLYRGISEPDFDRHIRGLFRALQQWWGGVPFEVVNDGEVTALAGSMSLRSNAVLGISLGTSTAAGYVTPDGNITPWLNELAFVPIDYRAGAPADEWSGDPGVGAQYFSQQAVSRLLPAAGIEVPAEMPLADRLVEVQRLMAQGDPRARRIYEAIGVYLGYGVAHFADFYAIESVLVLGRVTSGEGGDLIVATAERVLKDEFPALAERIRLRTPDEQEKRHGQAIAAASLPVAPARGVRGARRKSAPREARPRKANLSTREAQMRFSRPDADVFVPDGTPMPEALRRATHVCVGAHQDDQEFMAFHGIAECFGRKDQGFAGVVVTNGGGSSRTGIYADYTDARDDPGPRPGAAQGRDDRRVRLRDPADAPERRRQASRGIPASWPTSRRSSRPCGPRWSTSTTPRTSTTRTWPCACARSRRSARCRRPSGRRACSAARSGATSTG